MFWFTMALILAIFAIPPVGIAYRQVWDNATHLTYDEATDAYRPLYQRLRKIRLGLMAGLCGVLGLLCLVSCTSSIEGGSIRRESHQGEQHHANKGVRVHITAAGVSVETAQDVTATTQPSEIISTRQPSAIGRGTMPTIGKADEGQIAGVSFEQIQRRYGGSWPLFLVFVGGAVVAWWWYRSIAYVIAFAAGAVLAALYPSLLVVLAIAAIAALLLLNRRTIVELVRGGQRAIDDPQSGSSVKLQMAVEHSSATKAAVRSAKGKP